MYKTKPNTDCNTYVKNYKEKPVNENTRFKMVVTSWDRQGGRSRGDLQVVVTMYFLDCLIAM